MQIKMDSKKNQLEKTKDNWSAFVKGTKWAVGVTALSLLMLGLIFTDLF